MKICFITATLVGGGAERVIANLSNEMAKRGHEVTVLLTAGYVVEYDLHKNVKVLQIGDRTAHSIKGRLSRVFLLRKYFKQNRDTYYVSMPTDTSIFVLFAALFLRLNLVVSERSDPNNYEHKKLRDIAYLFAKKVVFQTPDAMKYFPERLQKYGEVIGNPLSEHLEEPYVGERKKEIVAIGRLETVKNHKLLIDSFSDICNEFPDYTLCIYGKGTLQEELENYICKNDLEGKVILGGFSEKVWERAKEAAVYVIASDYEGLSNSLLEAMALEMPVVATDCPIGGASMLIENGKNGLLVPVGDRKALAEAMRTLITNPKKAKELGAEAAKVRNAYSVEKITDEWLQFMKE